VNRSRARQWSRSAFALSALFLSFPIAARLLLGEWAFEGATGIAGLWLAAGVYLYLHSRRLRTLPDPAELLDEAIRLFSVGETRGAMELLERAIRENPRFWQAYQCRGEARMQMSQWTAAAADLDEAIRLAPDEPLLRELRARVDDLRRGEG